MAEALEVLEAMECHGRWHRTFAGCCARPSACSPALAVCPPDGAGGVAAVAAEAAAVAGSPYQPISAAFSARLGHSKPAPSCRAALASAADSQALVGDRAGRSCAEGTRARIKSRGAKCRCRSQHDMNSKVYMIQIQVFQKYPNLQGTVANERSMFRQERQTNNKQRTTSLPQCITTVDTQTSNRAHPIAHTKHTQHTQHTTQPHNQTPSNQPAHVTIRGWGCSRAKWTDSVCKPGSRMIGSATVPPRRSGTTSRSKKKTRMEGGSSASCSGRSAAAVSSWKRRTFCSTTSD